ncbi:hypothetical protein SCHPADRAFT_889702 [Schizopora paradoxa]|uniref:Uncharacterized protein n=1 Tax=Schizopora paradoxa TaxID=27342 RepID=A0A0H2SAN8_9AGAM|nr:hypothetical protein SCHPADRAFT_889702 [Schizopora paradoxa]
MSRKIEMEMYVLSLALTSIVGIAVRRMSLSVDEDTVDFVGYRVLTEGTVNQDGWRRREENGLEECLVVGEQPSSTIALLTALSSLRLHPVHNPFPGEEESAERVQRMFVWVKGFSLPKAEAGHSKYRLFEDDHDFTRYREIRRFRLQTQIRDHIPNEPHVKWLQFRISGEEDGDDAYL